MTDIRVQRDEVADTEHVSWPEPSYSTVEKAGGLPVELEPSKSKGLTRALEAIVPEIHRRVV